MSGSQSGLSRCHAIRSLSLIPSKGGGTGAITSDSGSPRRPPLLSSATSGAGATEVFAVQCAPTCRVLTLTEMSYERCSNEPTCLSPGSRRIGRVPDLPWYLEGSRVCDDWTPPMNRCQEHADVVIDNSICCKCGFKTNPCDPDGNYKRWGNDYQIHRNCNHPGPRIHAMMIGTCTEEGCTLSPYSGDGKLCLWHFVRSPQGRVAEGDKEEIPSLSGVCDTLYDAMDFP